MTQLDNDKVSSDEISLKDLVIIIGDWLKFLWLKRLLIIGVAIVSSLLGFVYAITKKPVYIAANTFVLDEGNSGGGMSQYAGLASLAGIDLGGGGNGIFQGDNIIELYKSRVMISKTLLSQANFDGKPQLLIERYIDFSELREKWKKNNLQNISFNGDPEKFNRSQDSIITNIVETFNKKILNVTKLDKKLSIIKVEVATTDELFSKEFSNRLVETVNNFYTQTKTKNSSQNVYILQKQADSVRLVLDRALNGVASALDAAPNANPALLSLRVPSQKRQVDVQASSSIYSEIIKNLEISKLTLRQQTPLIQVIDKPVLPLPVDKSSKLKSLILGSFLGGFLTVLVLSARRFFKAILK